MIKKGRYLEVATSIAMLLAGATSSNAATLLHQYDFTSGVTDLVGSQNGTLLGDANVSAGRLNLDGSGNYVQFATSIIPTNGSYSVTLFGQRNANQATFTEMISQGQSGGGPAFTSGQTLQAMFELETCGLQPVFHSEPWAVRPAMPLLWTQSPQPRSCTSMAPSPGLCPLRLPSERLARQRGWGASSPLSTNISTVPSMICAFTAGHSRHRK